MRTVKNRGDEIESRGTKLLEAVVTAFIAVIIIFIGLKIAFF
jgi:hypothetical protein